MKTKFLKIILAAIIFNPLVASAYVDFNAFYTSDSFKTSATSAAGSMFIEGSVGLSIDSKKTYMIGWNYSMFSVTGSGSATTKYSSTQMGPRLIWNIGREKNWSVGLGYNLITSATYSDGSGTTLKWKGSGMKADVGYSFFLKDDITLGVRLNYASASYNEQLTAADEYSKVAFARSHIYPSTYFMWVW